MSAVAAAVPADAAPLALPALRLERLRFVCEALDPIRLPIYSGSAWRGLAPPALVIDLEQRRIQAASEVIHIKPAALAFYALMARRRLQGLHAARSDTDGLDAQYLSEYKRIVGDYSGDYERAEQALAEGMSVEDFDQRKARTNAAPYLIQGDGTRPRTRFRLRRCQPCLLIETKRFATLCDEIR